MTTAGDISTALRRLPLAAQNWLHGLPGEREIEPLRQLLSATQPLIAKFAARWRSSVAPGDRPRWAAHEQRLLRTLGYHWWRFSHAEFRPLEEVVEALLAGKLSYAEGPHEIIAEAVLCECCSQGEEEATRLFLERYSEPIRNTARQIGGSAAARQLHDFPAELVVPRENRPPRLGMYGGYTPLGVWLQQVIRNEWVTRCRKRTAVPTEEIGPLPLAAPGPEELAAAGECVEKLKPLFRRVAAMLTEREAALLRMVILDGTPQVVVAKLLDVHKSTITRSRQRACEKLQQAFQAEVRAARGRGDHAECLTWLAGASGEFQRLLAEDLALHVRNAAEADQ